MQSVGILRTFMILRSNNNFDAMALLPEFAVLALLYLLIRTIVSRRKSGGDHRRLPPGPRGFPVVGALPLLGSMPHVALANMAKTYGPVMYLKVGSHGMVVASTPEAARSFLKTLDSNFSDRPVDSGARILAYDAQDMVFARYGPKWRLLRKLSNVHMLGGKALEGWGDVRRAEVGYMLEEMYTAGVERKPVVVSEMLVYAMANMIGKVMLRKRVFVSKGKEVNEFKEMVVELMTTAGYFNIGDFIPAIAWMDLQGIQRGMKKLHKKFDDLIDGMLNENLKSSGERATKPDFLDALLSHLDAESSDMMISRTNIKALLLNLFTAGTDTSSSIIEWALAEMMKNPDILRKAQDEMDQVVGRGRRLEESDIPKLPYLQAICKETFRKHPSTPLNLPRISSKPCVVNGYYIPRNTRLSVNIWAIGRDPQVWENPTHFNPERFLSGKNAKMDVRGNDFELIPFGAGRRICAGARMGVMMVEYILGTLVHSFEWKFEGEMDMEESFGLALQKAVPLEAIVTPRLTPNNYFQRSSLT